MEKQRKTEKNTEKQGESRKNIYRKTWENRENQRKTLKNTEKQ